MRIAGIICEYNPLHFGHAYHLRETRTRTGADLIVCLMSGEFTQRGEPAICNKWTRARMAIHAGADVVLELPFLYAVRSAEHFAAGAVRILHSIGADVLSFGAECSDVQRLQYAAQLLEDESADFSAHLRSLLAQGQSYAAARRAAAGRAHGEWLEQLLSQPNNVLAIEYLRAIERFCCHLEPLAVERLGSGHDSVWANGAYPNSHAVREAIMQSPAADWASIFRAAGVPCGFEPTAWQHPLFTLLSAHLRRTDPGSLDLLPDMEHGLAYRLIGAGRHAVRFDELVQLSATRRYPPARIRRLLLYALLSVTRKLAMQADSGELPLYGHVLAVRKDALDRFGVMCKESSIPVAASPNRLPPGPLLRLDEDAADIYGLLCTPVRQAAADFTNALPVVAVPSQ